MGKAGLRGELARFWLAHQGTDSGAAMRERGGHAVERADRVKHPRKVVDVVLEVRGDVELVHQVGAIARKRAANRPKQPQRIDRVVDDLKGRDEVELILREP